jgi:Protein of unknown function (DUF2380)
MHVYLEDKPMLKVLERSIARFFSVGAVLSILALTINLAATQVRGESAKSVAMLGVFLQNDNEGYEPTSDAERARIVALESQFKSMLEESGGYKFVAMTPEIKTAVAKGQTVGECGGCEVEYGKALAANTIAWVRVQKISNLIMNMNVYIADVDSNKMLFLHSVDIRGNTNESWSRSMEYLLKNYLLQPAG